MESEESKPSVRVTSLGHGFSEMNLFRLFSWFRVRRTLDRDSLRLNIALLTWNIGGEDPLTNPSAFRHLFPAGPDGESQRFDVVAVSVQESRYSDTASPESDEDEDEEGEELPHPNLQHTVYEKGSELSSVILGSYPARNILKIDKGGVAIRMRILDTSIAFVGCHLVAHRHHANDRLDQLSQILEGARMGRRYRDLVSETDHVFVFGDLNFRLDPIYVPGQQQRKISKRSSEFVALREKVFNVVTTGAYSDLQQFDQLALEMATNERLPGFREGLWNDPHTPTFKLIPSLGPTPAPPQYSPIRIPSYCDRVLWHSLPGLAGNLIFQQQVCVESVRSSDHLPVFAQISLQARPAHRATAARHNPVIVLENVRLVCVDETGDESNDRGRESTPSDRAGHLSDLTVPSHASSLSRSSASNSFLIQPHAITVSCMPRQLMRTQTLRKKEPTPSQPADTSQDRGSAQLPVKRKRKANPRRSTDGPRPSDFEGAELHLLTPVKRLRDVHLLFVVKGQRGRTIGCKVVSCLPLQSHGNNFTLKERLERNGALTPILLELTFRLLNLPMDGTRRNNSQRFFPAQNWVRRMSLRSRSGSVTTAQRSSQDTSERHGLMRTLSKLLHRTSPSCVNPTRSSLQISTQDSEGAWPESGTVTDLGKEEGPSRDPVDRGRIKDGDGKEERESSAVVDTVVSELMDRVFETVTDSLEVQHTNHGDR